ncbi:tetratricopeptide repeat protein [Rheinheimera sp. WS51]|uniref:tetratricopeptide repeat protein n=1 Tax=Rheinheimera sp. WS51 TaxID=3425886 RepID=UPI003D94E097
MRINQYLVCKLALALTLAGCSILDEPKTPATLNQLPAFDPSAFSQQTEITETALDELYQQILSLSPQPQMRQKILYRLSQLRTQQFERQDLPLAAEKSALQALIIDYQALLQQYPDDPNNELLRYQLARSYDLLAQPDNSLQQLTLLLSDYPDSNFAAEAWFRKADIHYGKGDYSLALAAYLEVLDQDESSLSQHARYMAGWSHFKLQQFNLADQQFLQLLDHSYNTLLIEDKQQGLRQEVFNILSISLSYQQQAQSLQALLQQVRYDSGERPLNLVAQLYQALAEFLQQKGFTDKSLASYRLFIADYADTYTAAEFQLQLIEHYLATANATEVLTAQQQYIDLFNTDSAFWQRANETEQSKVIPHLLQYLNYFARYHYAQALAAKKSEQQAAFNQAIPYWQQMLNVVDSKAYSQVLQEVKPTSIAINKLEYNRTDIRYLLAESYAGSQQFENAYALYVDLGYMQLESASLFVPQEAAYKALVLAEQLVAKKRALSQSSDSKSWTFYQQQWLQQQNDFVQHHPAHPAAQQVALQQLQQDYRAKRYLHVIDQAGKVIDWLYKTELSEQLAAEALFLRSQSEIALNYFNQAELSLQQLLALSLSSERKSLIQQQYASSIYQQAQQPDIEASAAIAHLTRLLDALPDSSFHEAALFEKIGLLINQKNWSTVPTLLQRYIKRYPNSERIAAANAQLIQSYQQLGQWQLAADQLLKHATTSTEPKQRREALWLAADYFLQAENIELAISTFRDYANQYTKPHDIAQEARQHLVELYQLKNDVYRKNFWLAKLVSFEQAEQGTDFSQSNARTQQLAADAALALGDHEFALFTNVKLRRPLQANLTKKRQHMQDAIGHYQQSISYGVATSLPQAQFSIAKLYEEMAKALLASERPQELTALAAEQYDLLLEEQAYPFEEQAIELYRQTTTLVQQQLYDPWVKQSFERLKVLLPAEFDKTEAYLEIADEAH